MNVSTRFIPCATVLLALVASPAIAQDTTNAWDVTLARGETREIDFTTEEGTWMSVDISPDGQWIVFDLLAHIYRVPAAGGRPRGVDYWDLQKATPTDAAARRGGS